MDKLLKGIVAVQEVNSAGFKLKKFSRFSFA